MYYYGEGIPKDYGKALEWYEKAANQGNPDAQDKLVILYGYTKDHEKGIIISFLIGTKNILMKGIHLIK